MGQLDCKERLALIDANDSRFSVREQCRLLQVNRSRLYYNTRVPGVEELALEREIQKLYQKLPFYGVEKTTILLKQLGFQVGSDRVRNIRKRLNLRTIYPRPNLSKPRKEYKKYPYLLKNLKIVKRDQVWSTDITYIRIRGKGWCYLVCVIDWYSRYILAFEISISLEVDFCLLALEKALAQEIPEIFNTDQGSQFTSEAFLKMLEDRKILISMDSVGRALDNIRCERFWRSVKYEEVFLNEYENVAEARKGIGSYIQFYNHERIHQSLNYHTPYEIYMGLKDIDEPAV